MYCKHKININIEDVKFNYRNEIIIDDLYKYAGIKVSEKASMNN